MSDATIASRKKGFPSALRTIDPTSPGGDTVSLTRCRTNAPICGVFNGRSVISA